MRPSLHRSASKELSEQEPAIGPGLGIRRASRRDTDSTSSRLHGVRTVIVLAGVLMTIGALYFSREFLVAGGRRRAPDLRPQPDRPRVRASAPAAGRRGPRGRARVRGPGRLRLGAGDPGRRPRQRDSDLPGPPQAQDRGDPWSEPRQRDREGPDGDQGGRRRAPEGRQAGQGGREALARGGEAAELGHVAVSSTGPSGRQRRARAGPRDLHAPRAIATAGSADPAHRRRAHRDDHQGHGRGRSADHELPDDADAHQRHLRARRDRGRLPHRPPVRLPVGLPRGRPPLHPLRRTLGGRRRGQPRRRWPSSTAGYSPSSSRCCSSRSS